MKYENNSRKDFSLQMSSISRALDFGLPFASHSMDRFIGASNYPYSVIPKTVLPLLLEQHGGAVSVAVLTLWLGSNSDYY